MKPVSFVGIADQQAEIRHHIEAAIKRVLDHGAYVNGPEIDELEAALVEHTGAAAAVGVSSGTDALVIGLLGEGVGPGDAVFLPAFTYNASANAVLLVGATPVFVDIEETTFNMDPEDLIRRIDAVKKEGVLKPRLVMTVDLFGRPADYDRIGEIAAAEKLHVLADAAQSLGGRFRGKQVGAIAPVTATSFFPTKTLGAYGDAGAIFTTDPAKAELWQSLRFHGTDEGRRLSVRVGMNGRIDTFQAAILLEKLKLFKGEWDARDRAAQVYMERLAGKVGLAEPDPRIESAWGLFSILAPKGVDRDALRGRLQEHGVPTAIYYTHPLHQHAAFQAYAPEGGLPVCEMCSERILSIPMHPYLTEEQAHFVCDTLIANLD